MLGSSSLAAGPGPDGGVAGGAPLALAAGVLQQGWFSIHSVGRLVTCRLVCLLPPAQEQLRVPQMARSSHSDTELEEPTQLAVSSYLATGVLPWATAKLVLVLPPEHEAVSGAGPGPHAVLQTPRAAVPRLPPAPPRRLQGDRR